MLSESFESDVSPALYVPLQSDASLGSGMGLAFDDSFASGVSLLLHVPLEWDTLLELGFSLTCDVVVLSFLSSLENLTVR